LPEPPTEDAPSLLEPKTEKAPTLLKPEVDEAPEPPKKAKSARLWLLPRRTNLLPARLAL
jgi:hypothetical protein